MITRTSSLAKEKNPPTISRSPSMSKVAVLLVVMFASAAQADANFRNCFCFQSDGTWCGANGNNDFWRDSCRDWAEDALLWTIPAFLAWIGFLFFPFVFFAARMCCNCCGGRQPTDGCCCPSTPSVRVFEDGHEEPIPRRYSNRSIFCTKFFFASCFGLWVYYSVGVYVLNHRVDNALNDVTNSISFESSKISSMVIDAVNATQTLVNNDAPFISSSLVFDLQAAQTKYLSVDNDIQNIVNHIQHAENDQSWGRYEDAFRIPSIALCILFPAFVMMLCNCRNAALTIGSGLMSLTAVLVVTAFITHELVAQASTALCNDYNDTLVPSVLNAAKWGHGCGQEGITSDLSTVSLGYFNDACKQGLADLCADDAFQCPPNAYQNLCVDAGTIGTETLDGWATLAQLLNSTFTTSIVYNDIGCTGALGGDSCTISQCASYCSEPDLRSNSQLLVDFMDSYSDSMNVILVDFYPAYVNCTALYEALMSTGIHGQLCNEFSTQFTNISIQFLALSCLSIAAVILLILGAKRFMKMEKLDDQETRGSTFAYRVLLQTDQERAVMGSPLLGSRTGGGDYQAAEPVVGYPTDDGAPISSGAYGSVQNGATLGSSMGGNSCASMCTVAA